MAKKIAMLFGSGASHSYGYPNVADITGRAISGNDVIYDEKRGFEICDNSHGRQTTAPQNAKYVDQVVEFIKLLGSQVNPYLVKDRSGGLTYEEIGDLLIQIAAYDDGDGRNYAIAPFVENLAKATSNYQLDRKMRESGKTVLGAIARYSLLYVYHIVREEIEIAERAEIMDQHLLLKDACSYKRNLRLSVSTLNHDSLLERCLRDWGVEWNDGFQLDQDNLDIWHPDNYEKGDARVTLLKLHGSIDWLHESSPDASWPLGVKLIRQGSMRDDSLIPKAEAEKKSALGTLILLGNQAKFIDYLTGAGPNLLSKLQRDLDEADALIVVGYGFRDAGINQLIFQRLYQSLYPRKRMKLIIIDPHYTSFLRGHLRIVVSAFSDPLLKPHIHFIGKDIKDAKWADVEKFMPG